VGVGASVAVGDGLGSGDWVGTTVSVGPGVAGSALGNGSTVSVNSTVAEGAGVSAAAGTSVAIAGLVGKTISAWVGVGSRVCAGRWKSDPEGVAVRKVSVMVRVGVRSPGSSFDLSA